MIGRNLSWFVRVLASACLSAAPAANAETPPTCVPDEITLCLGGRFAVTATWSTSEVQGQAAAAVAMSDVSGYFWFFDASNVEVVVKILDGCAINNARWVFGTTLTSLAWSVAITDTVTGDSLTYGAIDSGLPPTGNFGDTNLFPGSCS